MQSSFSDQDRGSAEKDQPDQQRDSKAEGTWILQFHEGYRQQQGIQAISPRQATFF